MKYSMAMPDRRHLIAHGVLLMVLNFYIVFHASLMWVLVLLEPNLTCPSKKRTKNQSIHPMGRRTLLPKLCELLLILEIQRTWLMIEFYRIQL